MKTSFKSVEETGWKIRLLCVSLSNTRLSVVPTSGAVASVLLIGTIAVTLRMVVTVGYAARFTPYI